MTKNNHFGKSHNVENCKAKKAFGLFENPVCCKIFKKIGGGSFGDEKNFEKKVS